MVIISTVQWAQENAWNAYTSCMALISVCRLGVHGNTQQRLWLSPAHYDSHFSRSSLTSSPEPRVSSSHPRHTVSVKTVLMFADDHLHSYPESGVSLWLMARVRNLYDLAIHNATVYGLALGLRYSHKFIGLNSECGRHLNGLHALSAADTWEVDRCNGKFSM